MSHTCVPHHVCSSHEGSPYYCYFLLAGLGPLHHEHNMFGSQHPLRQIVGRYKKHAIWEPTTHLVEATSLPTNSELLLPTLPKDSKVPCRKIGAPKPSEGLAPKPFHLQDFALFELERQRLQKFHFAKFVGPARYLELQIYNVRV